MYAICRTRRTMKGLRPYVSLSWPTAGATKKASKLLDTKDVSDVAATAVEWAFTHSGGEPAGGNALQSSGRPAAAEARALVTSDGTSGSRQARPARGWGKEGGSAKRDDGVWRTPDGRRTRDGRVKIKGLISSLFPNVVSSREVTPPTSSQENERRSAPHTTPTTPVTTTSGRTDATAPHRCRR